MKARSFVRACGVVGVSAVTVMAAALWLGPHVHAAAGDGEDARIRRGFEVAPVPLNLSHKNRDLVGLGSYIVNAVGECNGCHSQGPQTEYLPGGNPYFGQPAQLNPATYLGGGRDFGEFPGPGGPHIVSRNLTPDHTGLAIGGDTFEQFKNTIRTGHDPDQVHPNLPFPFRGDLLQIMPWPAYRDMTDRDLRAIYEYLSAIPCIASAGHTC